MTGGKKTPGKAADIIFTLLFVILLFIPVLGIDTTKIIDSKTENRRMQTWPGLAADGSLNPLYERYVEDRVLFRKEAVQLYGNLVYGLTGEFAETIHMEGKEGELFPAEDGYIRSYQHLATDDELINDLAVYLDRTSSFLESRGIIFVFMSGLDKKSVYDEDMPDYLHVDYSRKSILEALSDRLDERMVPYVIPVRELKDEKESGVRVYNKTFDATHWNGEGAYTGMKLLGQKIRSVAGDRGYDPKDFPPLKRKWFKTGKKKMKLDFSVLDIYEEVPVFKLRKHFRKGVTEDKDFPGDLEHVEGVYAQHFISENAASDKTLLIFGDSFIRERPEYLLPQYKNIYTVGRQNYMYMEKYVDKLRPDVVVFEVAERAFVDDLYNYTELGNITYP